MFEDETWAELVEPFENMLSYSSSYWYKSPHFTNQMFSKKPFPYFNVLVFTYSSNLVHTNKYVNGNQQHCVINKVRTYHDEVEKAVANFLASKLKEYWLKDGCSLLKGW